MKPVPSLMLPTSAITEYFAARHAAMFAQTDFVGIDDLNPTGPHTESCNCVIL